MSANIFSEAGQRSSDGYGFKGRQSRSSISSTSTVGSQLQTFATKDQINELQEDKFVEPLTRTKLVCMALCVFLPNMALIAFFSTMGKGEHLYNAIANRSATGDYLLCLATLIAFFMLIFDWLKIENIKVRAATGLIPTVFFFLGVICKGRKYPWGGVIATLFIIPFSLGYLHVGPLKNLRRNKFYGATAALTSFCSVCMAAMFWYYMFIYPRRQWDQETKYYLVASYHEVYKYIYKERPLDYFHDCGPDKNTTYLNSLQTDVKADIDVACKNAATLWFLSFWSPFIAIGYNVTIAIFCHATGTVQKDVSSQQRILLRFLMVFAFLAAGMYGTATMSATSLRLGSTLLAFFFAGIVILCVWLYVELDHNQLYEAAQHSKLMQQFAALTRSDWTRAFGLGFVAIPLLILLSLSCLTNAVRRKRRKIDPDNHDELTPTGHRIVQFLLSWNLTSVFLKITVLGELFFTLQVGVAKVTYIFLSYLNDLLAPVSFTMCCGLVFLIGGTMFLLPPVPGLPVYVFAGILLGEKGRQDENVGFAMAIAVASGVSLFTKLCACVGQYMIGYFLGRSLKVQQLIGVDKVPTRAIEMVLKKRGLGLGKVSILVGGPDWPTSVTCGIIRVNIPQMLFGTLPVLVLLVPCILAGAFMGRVTPGEDSEWNMMANAATALAAMVNMSGMAYAVYTISDTIQIHGEELAKPRREHEAIAELTRKEQEFVDYHSKMTAWSTLSCTWKLLVILVTCGMYLSNAMFVIFAEMCFRPFAVSSKIDDDFINNGLEGDVLQIVISPMGHIALGLCFMSALGHFYFVKRMSERAWYQFAEQKHGKRRAGGVYKAKGRNQFKRREPSEADYYSGRESHFSSESKRSASEGEASSEVGETSPDLLTPRQVAVEVED